MRPRHRFCLALAICIFGSAGTFKADGPKRHPTGPIQFVGERIPPNASQPASPAATSLTVNVAPNFSLSFSPNPANILVGDTIHWVWNAGGHNVRSGSPCTVDSEYCSPNDMNCTGFGTSSQNATYDHTFAQAGTYSYFCSIHCSSGMTGTINVLAPFVTVGSVSAGTNSFTVNGQTTGTTVATMVTVKSASDLINGFANPVAVTANNAGVFTYTDTTAGIGPRFYRVSYP